MTDERDRTGMDPQSDNEPIRIGITLHERLNDRAGTAIKYLLLHLNTLQESMEFELTPDPLTFTRSSSGSSLNIYERLELSAIKGEVDSFVERQPQTYSDGNEGFHISGEAPHRYVFITDLSLIKRHYLSEHRILTAESMIITLGDWDRYMAPPSLIESILTNVLISAAYLSLPANADISHIGTKGCLFDFNHDLVSTRYKTLQSFVCSSCREEFAKHGREEVLGDILRIQKGEWLGSPEDPSTPAGILANLGVNLFVNKGLKPTEWEKMVQFFSQESLKAVLKGVITVILTVIAAVLGLKELI